MSYQSLPITQRLCQLLSTPLNKDNKTFKAIKCKHYLNSFYLVLVTYSFISRNTTGGTIGLH